MTQGSVCASGRRAVRPSAQRVQLEYAKSHPPQILNRLEIQRLWENPFPASTSPACPSAQCCYSARGCLGIRFASASAVIGSWRRLHLRCGWCLGLFLLQSRNVDGSSSVGAGLWFRGGGSSWPAIVVEGYVRKHRANASWGGTHTEPFVLVSNSAHILLA